MWVEQIWLIAVLTNIKLFCQAGSVFVAKPCMLLVGGVVSKLVL